MTSCPCLQNKCPLAAHCRSRMVQPPLSTPGLSFSDSWCSQKCFFSSHFSPNFHSGRFDVCSDFLKHPIHPQTDTRSLAWLTAMETHFSLMPMMMTPRRAESPLSASAVTVSKWTLNHNSPSQTLGSPPVAIRQREWAPTSCVHNIQWVMSPEVLAALRCTIHSHLEHIRSNKSFSPPKHLG